MTINIGDKVKVKKKYRKEQIRTANKSVPKKGEIIAISKSSGAFLVEFDPWTCGHDGMLKYTNEIRTPKKDQCWYINAEDLKKI